MQEISSPLLFSNRNLLSLALPIMADAVMALLAGLVDAAMVSSVGEAAVSAISLVDSINTLVVVAFSALATGGVVVTAQYIGSGNQNAAKTSANQLLYASTGIALAVSLVVMCFIPQLLRLVYGELDETVFTFAKTYFFYALLGMPFFAIANSCTALLRTMSRSGLAMILAAGANILNIIGNATLIYGFDMGVAGAAISTSFSRLVWAIVGLIVLHNKKLPVYFEKLLRFRLDWGIIRKILRVGVSNGVESGLFQIGKLLVASLIASFGTIAIAANAVVNGLVNIGWSIVSSLGTVLLTVVGQCVGAEKPDQARYYTKKIIRVAHVLTLVLFGSVFLLRNQLVKLYDFDPQTLEMAAYYTGVAAILTICCGYANAFLPVSAFRAAGDIRYTLVMAISTMFAFRVCFSYLLEGLFHLGLLSVWLGMFADWVCRSVLNSIRLRNGKWLKKRLID